jgi:hypothetical protein
MVTVAAPSDPPVVTPDVIVNLSLYGMASLVYLYIIYSNPDDNNLLSKVLYLLSVLGINIYLMWLLKFNQCKTSLDIGWVFGGSILTWILLFVPIFWLLENMYVWLQPFGNTFGYLFIKLMGVTSFMDNILKGTDGEPNHINKYVTYIRSDPWGFFSMLTTNEDATPDILQAKNAFAELKKDKLGPKKGTEENEKEFISYVRMKEHVAKFVFYLLTLNLMTDITAVFLMEKSPCEANDADEGNDGNGQLQDEDLKSNGNKTVYKTTE